MKVSNQKRMAADILKCGVHRVYINPLYIDEVANAVQKEDVRRLIDDEIISSRPIKGTSRSRARIRAQQKAKGRRRGHGSRKGSKNVRQPRKRRWMMNSRAQRRMLKTLREGGVINRSQYRRYYLKAKGGNYRSVNHMKSQLETDGIEGVQ